MGDGEIEILDDADDGLCMFDGEIGSKDFASKHLAATNTSLRSPIISRTTAMNFASGAGARWIPGSGHHNGQGLAAEHGHGQQAPNAQRMGQPSPIQSQHQHQRQHSQHSYGYGRHSHGPANMDGQYGGGHVLPGSSMDPHGATGFNNRFNHYNPAQPPPSGQAPSTPMMELAGNLAPQAHATHLLDQDTRASSSYPGTLDWQRNGGQFAEEQMELRRQASSAATKRRRVTQDENETVAGEGEEVGEEEGQGDDARARIDHITSTATSEVGLSMESNHRSLDLDRPIPRGVNTWNKLEKWIKFHPERLTDWEAANPAVSTPGASHSARISKFYANASAIVRKEFEDWWPLHLVTAPHEERMANYNQAHKVLTKLMWDMEQDYGVCGFAVLAHPDPDVKAAVVASEHSEDLFDGCVKNLNATGTAAKFANLFGAATKNNPPPAWVIATERLNALGEGEAVKVVEKVTKVPTEIPSKAASKTLVLNLIKWINDGMRSISKEKESEWMKDTKQLKSMIYKGVFKRINDTGLCVQGWPIEANKMLDGDVKVTVQGTTTSSSTFTITAGSLRNTSRWKGSEVQAVQEALNMNTLVLKRV
ncbi:hypothetical protein A4X03_0g6190 [Tilletia caries]|uniref:Uncharacterized protein n=1 Tax=Tilletia caries TaxID=13290 RepID=A0A8T8T2M1_9BASI|nr:hypothetical protein A4X03_0g6190 [Tilletia caries]